MQLWAVNCFKVLASIDRDLCGCAVQEQTQRILSKYAEHSDRSAPPESRDSSIAEVAANLACVSQLMKSVKNRLATIQREMAAPLEVLTVDTVGPGAGQGGSGSRGGSANSGAPGSHGSFVGPATGRTRLGARPIAFERAFTGSVALSERDRPGAEGTEAQRRFRRAGDSVRSLNRSTARFLALRDRRGSVHDVQDAGEYAG
jgi:hypothetical protein